jgi:5-methyltetrahydrofolate--homocysteine methyltransferase
MDGAMGTELLRAGLAPGECPEAWNLTRPEQVRQVHQAYRESGAVCFLTNTFQANPVTLAKWGLAEQLEEINRAAVAIARSVAGPDAFVLGDVGPFESPALAADAERVVRSLAGADALLLETCSDLRLLEAVVRLDLPRPVLFSLTYRRNPDGEPRTYPDDRPPEYYAPDVERLGATALGVNCGRDIGMGDILEILDRYRRVTKLPLFARPNAGKPVRQGEGWVYPHGPEEMAARVPDLVRAGARLIGGCCGTTPEHIEAFSQILDKKPLHDLTR